MQATPTAHAKQPADGEDTALVISYLTLRKAVGLLGVTFPVVLCVGDWLLGGCPCIEGSISAYYGTGMRDIFVGVLFAIALFMFSYRGYERRDEVAGKLACCFAIGVALFPEPSKVPWVPTVHYVFSAALFLTFSYFSLCLFTKTRKNGHPTRRKRWRNRVYVTCGVAMLAFIALIGLYSLLWKKTCVAQINPVFWLESLTLWAFGISWGVKGEAILKDN